MGQFFIGPFRRPGKCENHKKPSTGQARNAKEKFFFRGYTQMYRLKKLCKRDRKYVRVKWRICYCFEKLLLVCFFLILFA